MIFSFAQNDSLSKNSVQVLVDGSVLEGVLNASGQTMVSAKAIGKVLGRDVTWDAASNTVKIASRLDTIIERGYIRVGTAGDYKPFTYLNPETNEFEGYDIDAAKMLAEELGVKVEFIKTTWPTLMEDLLADKFDIAMGGISRRMSRQIQANFSQPYIEYGKSPLIRIEDKEKYKSLEDIDQSHVHIGVNPGGTNEAFVKDNIKNAQVTVVQNNLDIPIKVAEGEVDVMITDSIEALFYAKYDDRLYAALSDNPFTKNQMGYLFHRGDSIFADAINFWMDQMKLTGEFEKLSKKWVQ
ncbi:cyclohexadienyl dehydratase [Clostridium aceticum]|nr:cyclohexadienyl dehydratase [Clostridium aceticum]